MDLADGQRRVIAKAKELEVERIEVYAQAVEANCADLLPESFSDFDAQMEDPVEVKMLLSFVSRGGTIFLTSHILEIVERLSTHIGVIARGKMVAQGPIGDLRAGGAAGQSLEELFISLVGGEAKPTAALDWV